MVHLVRLNSCLGTALHVQSGISLIRVSRGDRSLLRSEGKSEFEVHVKECGGDIAFDVTGNESPAAVIATFRGIVMNG